MKLINIFITVTFLVLSSCGYKAVNNSKNYNFQLNDIEIIGNKNVNLYLDRIIDELIVDEVIIIF